MKVFLSKTREKSKMKKIILKFYFSKFPKGQNSLTPIHMWYTFYYLSLLHLSFIRLGISPFIINHCSHVLRFVLRLSNKNKRKIIAKRFSPSRALKVLLPNVEGATGSNPYAIILKLNFLSQFKLLYQNGLLLLTKPV
jgi:hypothetical protein